MDDQRVLCHGGTPPFCAGCVRGCVSLGLSERSFSLAALSEEKVNTLQQAVLLRVRFVPHKASRLMRVLCRLFPAMRGRWMTLGRTIYHPDESIPFAVRGIVEHELEHVRQMARWSVVGFLALYFFAPIPVGFAWFRWKFERDAYAHQIRCGALSPVDCASKLWRGYGWPWPYKRMLKWFEENAHTCD